MTESARVIREWDQEYEHTYASGKHLLWGTEPEGFVKTIVRIVRADSKGLEGLSVLDLGCGEGRHCAYLASLGFQIVGLDISRVALRKALELGDSSKVGFEIVLGDCLHLPFKEGVFDCILDVFTLEFIKDKGRYVIEISKALRVEGSFFAINARKKTGKEPHSVDQTELEILIRNTGMTISKMKIGRRVLQIQAHS